MASYNIVTEVLRRNMIKAVQSHSAKPPAKITGYSQTGFSEQPPAGPPLLPLCWDSRTGTVPLPCCTGCCLGSYLIPPPWVLS